MYYIYGQSGPSLLIESTDSMIESTDSMLIMYLCMYMYMYTFTKFNLTYMYILISKYKSILLQYNYNNSFHISTYSSWTDLNLPVCLSLLTRSQLYLCQLVLKFAHLSLSEATKMSGILVSIKCVRTTQVHAPLTMKCVLLWYHRTYTYFVHDDVQGFPQNKIQIGYLMIFMRI